MSYEERFWAKVDKTESCWLWRASLSQDGYGQFKLHGTMRRSHRVAWELVYGVVPNGLFVLHSCDNPPCVNPGHLFLGTNTDNMRDCAAKGRHKSRTHPESVPRGDRHYFHIHPERVVVVRGKLHGSHTHPERVPRGERHGASKLTTVQVCDIRTHYATGQYTQQELGALFGVSHQQIGRIVAMQQRING